MFIIALNLIIIVFLIAFISSFVSGMVGIGGSVIKYPLLLFIPPLLGAGSFTAAEVAGISAIDVLFTSIAGVLAYRKGDYLNLKLILVMGISVLTGSFLGGFGSAHFTNESINLIYAILATTAAIMMFVPKKQNNDINGGKLEFNYFLAVIFSFIVGVAAGIVGAGGAFMLVPIMLLILKIPTRITIASSLAITFLSSIGSAAGKIITGQVLYEPAIAMVVASIISVSLGAKFGKRVNAKVLQSILACLILITSIKIWMDYLA